MKNRALACALSVALLSSIGVAMTVPHSFVMAKSSSDKKFFKGDASGTTASLSDILKNQRPDGGWRKFYTEDEGEWAKSSIDNKATYTEIRRLADAYTKTKDQQYADAAIKGIHFLLNMQYANGGFPQVYKSKGYHTEITFNDDAMTNVLFLLEDVSNQKGDFSFISNALAKQAQEAVHKGVECILKTQIVSNGKLTAWCQQYNEKTLKPAGARSFEVPAITASESVGIIQFLKTRPDDARIKTSIQAAEKWLKSVEIKGYRFERNKSDGRLIADPTAPPLWARFYEINTNRPIFVGRDGVVKYKLQDIEQERRAGYAWYGTWPSKLGID
ncbi:pectate lyase [Paenibacillus campi]|uniref:pectate lyase n=1 Tax=Paenibacillus campi TaxID=3106031 RepID=UPI002AFF0819|nr:MULTISPECIES: pectate lyase [unclassified Paenibacillus]